MDTRSLRLELSDYQGTWDLPLHAPCLLDGDLITDPFLPGRVHALIPPVEGRNHASQLCWAANGDLLCVWMGGSGEGQSGMNILLSRLSPGQTRWSEPIRISDDDTRSEQNPLLWQDEKGHLHLLHTAQLVRSPDQSDQVGAFSMQWTARLRHRTSFDNGVQWSPTCNLLDDEAFCRHPPLQGQDGGWILPIYRSLAEGNLFGHDYSEVVCLSSEMAVTAIHSVPRSTGRVHGSLVRSEQGDHLLQFFRSRLADRIYRAIGCLDGSSWSEPTLTILPNNNSSIQSLRLASGRLAMIFNRFCLTSDQPMHWGDANWPYTRWPLTIGLSEDDGATWPFVRDIDQGQGFCGEGNWQSNTRMEYPSFLEGPAGVLHVSYSWGNQSAIRYLRLRESDLLGS